MVTTKQVLRLQSDQILDDPQIATRIRLKDLAATRAIQLIWVEPAAANWNVQFKDPTANDVVVYENLAQPLNNKTLGTPVITDFSSAQHNHTNAAGGGLVSHAALTNLTLGDPHTQYALLAGRSPAQSLRGGTAASEVLTLESTSNVTKGTINILDPVIMTSAKNITVSGGGEVLGLPALPSGPTAAASKAYVDTAVSGGASWRETLLGAVQLDSVNNAIAQAVAFYLVNIPVAGDTITIRDGTTTETFTFQAVSAAFQPAIGGTALISMQNLASRINTDSTAWSASAITTLQAINPLGNVVVIYRDVPTATPTDRIHGTFTTPADAKFVNYGGTTDYRSSTTANLPAPDPGTANFGFGRITAGLTAGEAHIVRADDSAYLWNDDLGVWQLSAGAVALATSGPGGGIVGQSTYDSNKGLLVTAGVAEVRVDTTTITFTAGQLSVAGGAVPVATSGSGGGTQGKVSADSDLGLQITAGVMRTKVDGVSVGYNLSGELTATAAPLAPTGDVSQGVLITRDIPATTAPTVGFISSDIPVQSYLDGATNGQLFDFVVPADYDSGDIEILASYQMSTAFGGNIRLETQAKIVRASTGSVDTATFPAVGNTLTPLISTNLTRSIIKTLPNPSGTNFQRGDTLQIYVKRLGADGADTHTGNWVVTAFEYRYLGQVFTRLMEPVADIFTPVSGQPFPGSGFFSVDIPTLVYSDATSQSSACRFVVPENWDGLSDALLRLQYALVSAAAGTVRLQTSGNVANVVTGAVVPISSVDFDLAVTADVNPHRTSIIRSIPASMLAPGNVIEIAIRRDTTVGGNAATGFQVINSTLAFGVTPIAGVTSLLTYYLSDPAFGNASGSVFADSVYPSFATDFERFFTLSSTSAAGVLHASFEGRLDNVQSQVDEVAIFIKGAGATPQYNLKIYAEGSGATPVYSSGLVAAPGASTQVVVPASSMSAQPTGSKRFFAVVETAIDAGESVSVSRPFVKVS
jgi:hypothetical protein